MALVDGAVAYYNFDEVAGDLIDQAGSADGTNDGADYGATGIINDAWHFEDSQSDKVSAIHAIPYASFSFSAWIYIESLDGTDQAIYSTTDTGANPLLQIIVASNTDVLKVVIRGNDGSGITTLTHGTALNINTWYHVVFTYNSADDAMKLYLNAGTPVTDTYGGNTWSAADIPYIAAYGQAGNLRSFFDGDIDEMGFWNVVLDATLIDELYNSGAGVSYPFSADATATPSTLTLTLTQETVVPIIEPVVDSMALSLSLISPTFFIKDHADRNPNFGTKSTKEIAKIIATANVGQVLSNVPEISTVLSKKRVGLELNA